MFKEITVILPNSILILITPKRAYANFDIDTWRSKYNLKDYNQFMDLFKPYRHKTFQCSFSKTGASIFNIKKEHVEEIKKKMIEFLMNQDNLVLEQTN